MKQIRILFLLCCANVLQQQLFAQDKRAGDEADFSTTSTNDFCLAVKQRLDPQGPNMKLISDAFISVWVDRRFNNDELVQIAKQANQLFEDGHKLVPDVANYLGIHAWLKSPTREFRVPSQQFFAFTDSCRSKLGKEEFKRYLATFSEFMKAGVIRKAGTLYHFRFQQVEADISFRTDQSYLTFQEHTYPALVVKKAILSFVQGADSIAIEGASGVLDFSEMVFVGSKGRFDWRYVGLDEKKIYAELYRYIAKSTEPGFFADSARLYYPGIKGGSIVGGVTDRIQHNKDYYQSDYPLFKSTVPIQLTNIVRNADFDGAFMLRGRRVFGTKLGERPATLFIKARANQKIIRLQADEYAFADSSKILSDKSRVTILLPDGDSLTHPQLRLVFQPYKPQVELIKDLKNPYYAFPMTSNYHRYGLYFEYIRWNPERDSIVFSSLIAQDKRPGALESEDYFFKDRYEQMKGILPFNPVGLIYQYIAERRIKIKAQKRKEAEEKRKREEEAELNGTDATSTDGLDPELAAYYANESGSAGGSPPTDGLPAESGQPVALKDPIFAKDIIKYFKRQQYEGGFIKLMPALVAAGYIQYEATTGEIKPLPRLYRWAKASRREKDFDVIQLVSLVDDANNADLNYKTKVFQVKGVESFTLSDSQMVEVRPENKTVQAKKNRDLSFGGLVYAGKLNLYGKGFEKFRFEYDKFKIACGKLDSVKFAPQRDRYFDPNKNPRLTRALQRLRIEGVTGAVYINKPTNKSGARLVAKYYPVFDCYTTSYVFWNASSIQKGIYTRKKLNFALDPFALDSVENFVIDNLEFVGTFNTSGIIPTYRDTLKPVSDNTYGIHEVIGDTGVALYGGHGRFAKHIQMDGYGLHGDGQLQFLSTVAESDTFSFHFDSTMAYTRSFKSKESTIQGVFYPDMYVGKVKYKWYPKQDSLILETLKEPIMLHRGNAYFRGKVVINKKGALGKGLIVSQMVQVESDSINLSDLKMQTHESTFRVAYKDDSTKYHFIANKAEVQFDLQARTAKFSTSTPGTAMLEFPKLKYKTALAEGVYDDAKGEITLQAKYPEARYNYWVSTAPDQYALSFPARKAHLFIAEDRINLGGVDSIKVADAIAYPNKGEATILPNGKLDSLMGARLVADSLHRYHKMRDVNMKIGSRIQYAGYGNYPYRSRGVKEQSIFLSRIASQPDTTTAARGMITEDAQFLLTDRIYFRDTVILSSRNRFMGFGGEVRIQTENRFLSDAWFNFRDRSVNPDTVFLPIKNPKNRSGALLTVGANYIPNRKLFYTNFFQPQRNKTDKNVLQAEGGLTYDQAKKEFRVGPRKKLEGQAYKGNVVGYDDQLNIFTSRGYLKFPAFFGAGSASIEMAGMWRDDFDNRTINTNLLWKLDLPGMPGSALAELWNKFNLFAMSRNDINFNDPQLTESMAEFLDKGDSLAEPNTLRMINFINSGPAASAIKLAGEVPSTFLFTDVRLTYNDSVKGFWSAAPLGLAGIGGKALNKMVDSKIEYRFGRVLPDGTPFSDTLRIYLQTDDVSWVYFEIRGQEVRTVSSEASYNNLIEAQAAKDDNRKDDPKNPQPKVFRLQEVDKQQYIRRFSRYIFIKK